jgi:single-strand DNA-binding protein
MAGSLNKVLLIGRLGNDPEIKQMQNGKSVARLSVQKAGKIRILEKKKKKLNGIELLFLMKV